MGVFDYRDTNLQRRHGPQGYTDYRSYRPWLQDESMFRCVYCLNREKWGQVSGEFNRDYFQIQANTPHAPPDYNNLVYACRMCLIRAGNCEMPNPCTTLTSDQIHVNPDGSLQVFSKDATKIIKVLGLNDGMYIQWREMWIRTIELAQEYHRELYLQLTGFPDDLPDLSRLRPPDGNTRPEGISESWFAKRERGELQSL